MAKLNGPLLSLEARGSLGPRLTFSMRKSGSQVRFQRENAYTENESQKMQRSKFWQAIRWWEDLDTDEKSQWNTLADAQ